MCEKFLKFFLLQMNIIFKGRDKKDCNDFAEFGLTDFCIEVDCIEAWAWRLMADEALISDIARELREAISEAK